MLDATTIARPVTRPVTRTPQELQSALQSFLSTAQGYRGNDSTSWNHRPAAFAEHVLLYPEGFAATLWDLALYENDERSAYREAEVRNGNDHEPISTYERDQLAALQQAELLGATADQRRKLRAIVEAEHTARQQNLQLQQQLAAQSVQLAAAVAELNSSVIDVNDRRIWSIFGKAAVEADTQGYCSVYDQISAAVGIPTRDELREEGYLEYPATCRFAPRSR